MFLEMGLDGPALKRFPHPPHMYATLENPDRPRDHFCSSSHDEGRNFSKEGVSCLHALLSVQCHHLAGFSASARVACSDPEPRRTERTQESQKKNQLTTSTPIPAAKHPPARLSDLNSGAWLTLTTAHRRAAGKGCRPPITGWSGAASETAAVGFESSATAWPSRRLVQLSRLHPPCKTAWAPFRFPTPSSSDGGSPPAC